MRQHRLVRPRPCVVGQLIVGLAVLTDAGSANGKDRHSAITELEADGMLSAEQALVYRLWAVRDPRRLPAELAELPAGSRDCATADFVTAFQLQQRGQLSTWAAEQVKQASDRPTSVGYFDSGTYALRVHYTDAAQANRARDVLSYAERSWQVQVETVGFRPPVGDSGGTYYGGSRSLDIYIGDAHGAGGFTAPEEDWPATGRSDCTSWVVISDQLSHTSEWMSTVAHEFSHVLQAAHDCSEWVAFWENTSTYMQDVTYDSIDDYIYFLPDFQQNPHLPFDYHSGGSSAYQYGAMIVAMTLDEAFGEGDGKTLRRVWEECEQNSFTSYEPDYFDAIDEVVREKGGQGLDHFQRVLTEWRYLTGTRADGAHLSEAADWDLYCDTYCEPPDDRVHPVATLPVTGTVREPVYVHGSSYVRLAMEQLRTGLLRVDFGGDPLTRWAVNVICGGSGPVSVTPLTVNAAGSATTQVQVSNSNYCTLAVTNLGLSTYDPDDDFDRATRQTYSYNYSFNFVAGTLPTPTITQVQPEALTCGGGELTIRGKNFVQGAVVQVDGEVAPISSLTSDTIVVLAPARGESGVAMVVVTNPDDQRAAWANAVVFSGVGCYCGCDATFECNEGCDCDIECFDCLCDHTMACDAECDCDPQCDDGCGCGAVDPAVGLLAAGLLGLLAWRRRSK